MESKPTIPLVGAFARTYQPQPKPNYPLLKRPGSPGAILVVGGSPTNQRLATKVLERVGYTVHIANHGLEALKFITTTRYWRPNKGRGVEIEAVLMHWSMPVMAGEECTRSKIDFQYFTRDEKHFVLYLLPITCVLTR